jgi:hypothetical protein
MLSRTILTKRRTPTPVNITFPGENTCQVNVRLRVSDKFIPKVYRAYTLSKGLGQHIEGVHSGIEPLGPSIIATGSTKSLYLLVKDGENCAGRVAVLQLGGEWMGKKIFLCAPFVRFQSIVEDELEIG